jgi:polysaccharide deacetylase 2 family uncharacterized protein YibQ
LAEPSISGLPSSELDRPLGAPRAAKPARRLISPKIAYGIASLPFLLIAGAAAYVTLAGSSEGPGPLAVSQIREAPRPAAQSPQQFSFSAQDAAQPPPERLESTAGQLEQDAGVRVMRPGGGESPGAVVIRVPDAAGPRLAPAPDRRLVERGRNGPLPRVGEDGARPSQVYARPTSREAAASPARIAILLGGLGISGGATADAISKLPPDISFAFAPYGSDLERQVQRARADGHEVFLQVPMEPFDYPDNDPGPHTLRAGAAGADNVERLRWVMSRFTGYVGIVNFMGARLMADEASLAPLLREVGERGLMVVDDGSSARSLMAPVAAGFRAPAYKADIVLDLAPRADAIDRELARLEAQARERGFAMASASALPLTIDRLQRWARTLEQKGIRLVPASAAAAGPAARAQTTGSIR